MTKIDGPVVQAAASQGGLVRRDQLRALGASNDVLDRLRRQGLLRSLTLDVFVLVGAPITSTLNEQAALWQAGPTAALSHASAGLRWELPRLADGTVEVVVAHCEVRPERTIGRVHVSRRLGPGQATVLDGVRLTSPGRTVADIAARCSSIHLEDCLLYLRRRSLIDLASFATELSAPDARRMPGRTRLLGVVADLMEREEGDTYLEDRFFAVLARAGVPMPVAQVTISVDGHDDRVDGLWGPERLIVELDGDEFHKTRADRQEDAARAARVTGAGYGLIRFTYDDLKDRPPYVVRTVLHHLHIRRVDHRALRAS